MSEYAEQTHRHRKQTSAYWSGEAGVEGQIRGVRDTKYHTGKR